MTAKVALVGTLAKDFSYSILTNVVLEFKSDGTFIEKLYDKNEFKHQTSGTYYYDEKNQLVMKYDGEATISNVVLNGNILHVYGSESEERIKLTKVN